MDLSDMKQQPDRQITVVCFGDSNTWGWNPANLLRYPKSIRWPDVLQDRLGPSFDVISEGLSGRTIEESVERVFMNGSAALPSVLGTNAPVDILIIMLGSNDCKYTQNESLDEIVQKMDWLLSLAETTCMDVQGFVPTIILAVPPEIRDGVVNGWLNCEFDHTSVEKAKRLSALYQPLAGKHKCLFLAASGSVEISDIDGVHMSEAGHKQLAELVWNMVKEASPTHI